jgi:hypothetical protein
MSSDVPGTLPSGTVTFLFTDVEGSTRLWAADKDAMSGERRDAQDVGLEFDKIESRYKRTGSCRHRAAGKDTAD